MRGGYVHNKVLIPSVVCHCRAAGAIVLLEHPVQADRRKGAVDLLAQLGPKRLVMEVENSCRRVCWDVEKARALGANALIILVPDGRVASACRREVRRLLAASSPQEFCICILTLGSVHQWLNKYFRLFSTPIETSASKTFFKESQHLLSIPKDNV